MLHASPSKTILKKQLKLRMASKDCQSILNQIPHGVKLISFDCFDTLLWRNVHEPKDVFYSLCDNEVMKKHGLTVGLRMAGENTAYHLNKIKKNQTQATLQDIYKQTFPDLNPDQLETLTQIELALEKETCFAYEPMIELIHALHDKGYQLIITSDIYFTRTYLKELLAATLPEKTLQCFNAIYTSCDEGTAKFERLFSVILKKHGLKPEEVCHIGDHPISDYENAIKQGMHAINVEQYTSFVNEIFRMNAVIAPFVDQSIRKTRPLLQHFKKEMAQLSSHEEVPTLIGYAVIGPLMLAFGEYIIQCITDFKNQSDRPVKVAYLLRDAYLPGKAADAISKRNFGTPVRISRFASFAASFRSVEDVDSYLAERIDSQRFHEIGKQLGLPKKTVDLFVKKSVNSNNPVHAFNQCLHRPEILKEIFNASKKYRERLYLYLKQSLDIHPGDTIFFVDLGYTGTTQLRLAPVFKEEYQIDIQGCYLLSLKTPMTSFNKSGLISPLHYDDNTLKMLVTYIAILEQVCTSTEASVVDFDEDGKPIMEASKLDTHQIEKVKPIQEACFRFINDIIQQPDYQVSSRSEEDRRDIAAITLARLLYFPTRLENTYFSDFNHDVNLGTDDTLRLFNTEQSLTDLHQRGWLHSLNVKSSHARMNYPAEWRAISIELSLALLTQTRFDFKLTAGDLSHRSYRIPVIIHDSNENNVIELDAHHTYDGNYSLIIPVVKHEQIGIAFGSIFALLQISAIDIIPLAYLYKKEETEKKRPAFDKISLHDLTLISDEVIQSVSPEGMLLFTDKNIKANEHVLRIIFKPLSNLDSSS